MSTKQAVDEIGRLLMGTGRTIAVAESLTGGQLSAAFAEGADASTWFRGGVVAYATEVKHEVLAVPDVPVVSEQCARAMAESASRLLAADIAVAVTGVGGPEPQDGQPPGTVWLATAVDGDSRAEQLDASGPPQAVCAEAVHRSVRAVLARLTSGSG